MAKVTIRPESEELILGAAYEVFHEVGFKRGTVRDIAARANMSVGSVASVGSKEQLLVRLLEVKIAEIQAEMRAEPLAGDPVDAVLGMMRHFFDFFWQEWPLSREYAAIIASGRYDSRVFPDLAEAQVDDFVAVLTAAGMDAEEARRRARVVYINYVGCLYLWSAQGEDAREFSFKLLEEAVPPVLRGSFE